MKPIFIIFLLISNLLIFGQSPNIVGKVNIDVEKGLFYCDLKITNLPKFDDLTFVLNKGMNLQYLKANGKIIGYNTDYGAPFKSVFMDEGLAYSPVIDTITEETIFNIRYSGSFPVYNNDTLQNTFNDSQVNIAFKNNVLRASYMTKWYPFLFDRTSNLFISKFTYNIEFICDKSTKSIYINGCAPQSGNKFNAISEIPQQLCLYIGNYSFEKINNTYFLNTTLKKIEIEGIDMTIKKINDFYNSILKQNNHQDIILAQIFSVGRKNQYTSWALAEYPAIIFYLDQLPKYMNSLTNEINDIYTYKILAHEIAHQYWGLTIQANNKYWGFFSESFAEYFSLKAIENNFGEEKYKEFLKENYLKEKYFSTQYTQIDLFDKPIPTNRWYNYYSIILLGLEQVVGKEKNYKVYQLLLSNISNTNLDFNYFKEIAIKAGISEQDWLLFENKYIKTDNCLFTVLQNLKNGK